MNIKPYRSHFGKLILLFLALLTASSNSLRASHTTEDDKSIGGLKANAPDVLHSLKKSSTRGEGAQESASLDALVKEIAELKEELTRTKEISASCSDELASFLIVNANNDEVDLHPAETEMFTGHRTSTHVHSNVDDVRLIVAPDSYSTHLSDLLPLPFLSGLETQSKRQLRYRSFRWA